MNVLTITRTILLLLLATIPVGSLSLASLKTSAVTHAPLSQVGLEPWSPDLRSSNITSLSQFPVGSEFPVRVNLTNAGPITGFDVSLTYNITAGPNVLQAVKTGNELSGGVLDPSNPPAGCSVLVARNQVDVPPGEIRFAAVILGNCTAEGNGTLFTILFRVTGTGATSIDIVRTSSAANTVTSIVGPGPAFSPIPIHPVDAYFRNKPGIPPVVFFTHNPVNPIANDTVTFNASSSFDPDNSTLPGRGIKRYLWNFGDGFLPTAEGVDVNHVFKFYFNTPAAGSFTVRLVAWDYDDQLPAEKVLLVQVAPGIPIRFSLNWSGYAVAGTNVSDVKGSWTVPAIVGPCPAFDEHSAFWIGIDGLDSQTVEQTGTESACLNGVPTYFAWYEFFPRPVVRVSMLPIHPGDIISAEVQFSNSKFTVSLRDLTTGDTFSRSGQVRGAQRSSAEWIAEAPSSRAGILPLANFGTVQFGQDSTGVGGTCSATIGPDTGPIGAFGSGAVEIKMVDSFILTKAQPSPLSADKTSFSVQWKNAA